MGKALKIWIVLVLTVLYCSAIGLSSYAFDSGLSSKTTGKEERYQSSTLGGLLIHLNAEITFTNFEKPSLADFKNPLDVFSAVLKLEKNLFRTLIEQYGLISLNLQIERQKADLIYPFHSFP